MKTYFLSDNKQEQLEFNLGLYAVDLEEHLHDFIEICYVLSGSGIHYVDNRPYQMRHGSMLYIDMGQSHRCDVLESMSYVNFKINPLCFYDPQKESEASGNFFCFPFPERPNGEALAQFEGKDCELTDQTVYKMLKEKLNRKKGYETVIRNNMSDLLIYMQRNFVTPVSFSLPEIPDKIKAAIQYIDEHCEEKIVLEEVCTLCNYSPAYFYKVLKSYCGFGFSEYLMKKRVNKAMFYLFNSDYSIDEIVTKTGFTNKTHFYKTFKKYIGVQPSFIKQYKERNEEFLQDAILKL